MFRPAGLTTGIWPLALREATWLKHSRTCPVLKVALDRDYHLGVFRWRQSYCLQERGAAAQLTRQSSGREFWASHSWCGGAMIRFAPRSGTQAPVLPASSLPVLRREGSQDGVAAAEPATAKAHRESRSFLLPTPTPWANFERRSPWSSA